MTHVPKADADLLAVPGRIKNARAYMAAVRHRARQRGFEQDLALEAEEDKARRERDALLGNAVRFVVALVISVVVFMAMDAFIGSVVNDLLAATGPSA